MAFNALDIVGHKFTSKHGEEYIVDRYLSRINGIHKYIVKFNKTKNEKEYGRDQVRNGVVTDIWKKEEQKTKKVVQLKERKSSMNKDYACLSNGKMNFKQPTLVLDQATKVTGYSIYINGRLEKYGTIKSFYDNINDRINEVACNTEQLIKTYAIKNLIIEDIFLGNNLTVFKHLALLMGVLINLAVKNRIIYTTVNALEWKTKYNLQKLGDRDMGKAFSKKIVLDHLGIEVVDDVSDSILIGYYFMGKNLEEKEEYNWE